MCVFSKELMISKSSIFLTLFLPHVHPSHCWGAHEQPCNLASECLFPRRDSLEGDSPWSCLEPASRGGTHMDWMLESTNTSVTPQTRGRTSQALSGHWQPSVWRFLPSHLRHFYRCLNNFHHLTQFLQDTQSGVRFRVASSLPKKSISRGKVCICLDTSPGNSWWDGNPEPSWRKF